MNSYDYQFRFIIIGDATVGKSHITLQFIHGKTPSNHLDMVGIQFGHKKINVRDKEVLIQLWDTTGESRFKTISKSFYRNAIGVLIVYDITQKETFKNVKYWLNEVKTNGNNHIGTILIGNKNDLQKERVVTYEQGSNLAKQFGVKFMEINSRDYQKVQLAWNILTDSILERIENGSLPLPNIGIKMNDKGQNQIMMKKPTEEERNRKCF